MLNWIKTHPQRTLGLLTVFIGFIFGALPMFQVFLKPQTYAAIFTVVGGVNATLAWLVKNTKPE